MKITPLLAGKFKLDGGAMFGVVPKQLWSRTNPADEKNLCTWAMRSMIIEDGDRLILLDTGLGDKQSEKFFGHYHPHGPTLDESLKEQGYHRDDITDVFLTHLHFDHCGGAIERTKDDKLLPTFKNAKYWSNENHWKWATEPNQREKASFLKENILPIEESGQLNHLDVPNGDMLTDTPLGFDVLYVNGHTDKQMIPHINYKGKKLVFMADLLPSVGHIPLPFVMGYDTRPLLTLDEKDKFLKKAADENYVLFLEHDSQNELCTVKHTEKGVRLDEVFAFREVFGE
ncbi:MBL fold metallo-hydrolase [Salibacter sp.]|jgi:glyoxylase-like metal-dependent hydrolase (beta-lactamase superfamily II)|uniref:MBL fold metallo-hydrolase n=1 Tax=Salibacter sp. TaxID=2010995 RepID=UPI002870A175|nr:MBL fold metallo-hydrolase [Salibacter sp.]MDR9399534.1 MBL fold metallo-hydrolase [Salibacter sp.]MDR9488452.1 MBL fold metallo-hydrolase [Salibacter sp.]